MSGVIPGNFVRKTGDTMTGDLTMNADIVMNAGKTVDELDVGAMPLCRVKTGTYTGDGNDNRSINIGVDLTAKSNVVVLVKAMSAGLFANAVLRIEAGQGNVSYLLDTGLQVSNDIQALTATGFQVGSGNNVNYNGTSFLYVVFYEDV